MEVVVVEGAVWILPTWGKSLPMQESCDADYHVILLAVRPYITPHSVSNAVRQSGLHTKTA
jgi:hypothetical protein